MSGYERIKRQNNYSPSRNPYRKPPPFTKRCEICFREAENPDYYAWARFEPEWDVDISELTVENGWRQCDRCDAFYVDMMADAYKSLSKENVGEIETMTGQEFEQWVAFTFVLSGWDAKVTQSSGDQGIDVLAQKDNVTVAVQCKLYSKPVGNTSVQEVYAGKAFYESDNAVVVSNAGFTESAVALASKIGVLLLLPSDIFNLDYNLIDELENIESSKQNLNGSQKLKLWRQRQGFSQQTMSKMCGIAQAQLSRYESGTIKSPSFKVLKVFEKITKGEVTTDDW